MYLLEISHKLCFCYNESQLIKNGDYENTRFVITLGSIIFLTVTIKLQWIVIMTQKSLQRPVCNQKCFRCKLDLLGLVTLLHKFGEIFRLNSYSTVIMVMIKWSMLLINLAVFIQKPLRNVPDKIKRITKFQMMRWSLRLSPMSYRDRQIFKINVPH